MKILSLLLAISGILLYIDHVYNKQLVQVDEFNRHVLQTYCKANIE